MCLVVNTQIYIIFPDNGYKLGIINNSAQTAHLFHSFYRFQFLYQSCQCIRIA